jgi:multicomponent Na+:H+ antiporter subunit E
MDPRIGWSAVASRALTVSLVWWAVSNGNAQSWRVGVPALACAVIVSVALLPLAHLVWRGLLKFVAFFLRRSLRGGTDVARRAFHPPWLSPWNSLIVRFDCRRACQG